MPKIRHQKLKEVLTMRWRTRKAAWMMAAAVLVTSMPVSSFSAQAEESVIVIRTEEEFLELSKVYAAEQNSEGKTVSLEADLNFEGKEFSPIPVFCGTFEGNDHTIGGISIWQSGSNQGLDRKSVV